MLCNITQQYSTKQYDTMSFHIDYLQCMNRNAQAKSLIQNENQHRTIQYAIIKSEKLLGFIHMSFHARRN